MASMGSKVLQIRAVEFAGKYQVPLRVLHSFKEGPGTLITLEDATQMETPTIAGIAFNRDEAKLTILGVPDMPGIAHKILGPIGDANIEVDVIVQNTGEDKHTDFSFTVSRTDLPRAMDVLQSVAGQIGARKCAAMPESPRCRWWAWACGPTPVSPARCSQRWPRWALISR